MGTSACKKQGSHCPVHVRGGHPKLNRVQETTQSIFISKITGANFAGVVLTHRREKQRKKKSPQV